jgi:ubiquinone/menaquinone biosynthesis C-methylase UbiE
LGTAESIPFPSSYFDTVIAIEVFEHLEEPRVFLDESFRVLENNGVLIIQTPNYPVKRAYDFVYWLLGRKGDPKDDPTHVSPQSFASLAEAVGRSGFEILSLSGRNVFGENRLKFLKEMKFGRLAPYISQKAIIIARKK